MTRIDLARAADIGNGIPSGTAFPGSPTADDLFYRTDLNLICFYDGTQWRSTQIFNGQIILENNGGSAGNIGNPRITSATLLGRLGLWKPTYDVFLMEMRGQTIVVTTNNGSNYWTVRLNKGSDGSVIGSFNTSADTAGAATNHLLSVNAASTEAALYVDAVFGAGAPGGLYCLIHVTYQLILT